MPFGEKEFQDISRTFGFNDRIQGLQAVQNDGNYFLQLCAAIILPATIQVILISWKIKFGLNKLSKEFQGGPGTNCNL